MSKFLALEAISRSIQALNTVHPFHGITFLACKKQKLVIGKSTEFAMDSITQIFLATYHKLDPSSNWFYQPFKSSDNTKKWIRSDYPAKGLQAINTQTFRDAFIHTTNTRLWGWSENYVAVLQSKLTSKKKIPIFAIAVWLYHRIEWSDQTTPSELVDKFISEFGITEKELDCLFDLTLIPDEKVDVFQSTKSTWAELCAFLSPAPDATPEEGGTLAYLETVGIGPCERFVLEPSERLTLITGDNGLGKTFLLEACWWALSGTWAGGPAISTSGDTSPRADITFSIRGKTALNTNTKISFDWKTMTWPAPKKRPTIPGLIVYARVDGSFAVWDPAKPVSTVSDKQVVLSGAEVWNGLAGKIEGLIRDWVRWQNSTNSATFTIFEKVLERLSPPDLGQLKPGNSVRIPGDPREIPTIVHPYGVTPLPYASAGVRRIITISYLIVWAWTEHLVYANQTKTSPQRRMVVLVDEIEAHLHPHWQRTLLPALMSVQEILSDQLSTQFIVASHSPLVLASIEPVFDSTLDSLVHLKLSQTGKVSLEKIDFERQGDISSWLTSPVFELRHARSQQAEKAIEDAKALQLKNDISPDEVKLISQHLVNALAPNDRFWPRWIFFAEQHGVTL
jgi:predicted ATPase